MLPPPSTILQFFKLCFLIFFAKFIEVFGFVLNIKVHPRDDNNYINALIHPERINQDWHEIQKGDPLFLDLDGQTIPYNESEITYPVFIGEAAYREKRIAMSFTQKETIKCSEKWIEEL